MVAVGWIRTNDLLVMSQTSYQLLHPAIYNNKNNEKRKINSIIRYTSGPSTYSYNYVHIQSSERQV